MRPWILGSLGGLVIVAASATAAVRAPDGEWIESVEGETAEIWAVGDADPPAAGRVARVIRRADPDRILYLGDVYPRGTLADFRHWAQPWGRLVRRMAPTPGNHDGPRAAEGFDPYWREVTGELPPTFYSFEAAGWQILQVNSEQPGRRPVVRWLREQVESGGNCRIAFWHRPRYTAGHHKGGDRRAVAYWDAIAGGARIIVNGHDHNLQRFRERDGMVEFVSGAGGRRLYPVDERHPRLAWSDHRHYGALRLSLAPGEARWRFVSARGKRLDSGTLRCRP
jgi:acid phosphatase type 7